MSDWGRVAARCGAQVGDSGGFELGFGVTQDLEDMATVHDGDCGTGLGKSSLTICLGGVGKSGSRVLARRPPLRLWGCRGDGAPGTTPSFRLGPPA